MINLLDLDRNAINALIADKPYRGDQVFQWLYQKRIDDIAKMSNLPKELRGMIARQAVIAYPAVARHQTASDTTEKFAYRLADGQIIESVLIPEEKHWTICVSSQVGCAMGCRFCCTATLGFKRNLTPGEILAQVLIPMQRYPGRLFRNIVVMGMGEPLLNYTNVVQAVRILSDEQGPDISTRRITISTCGIVPQLRTLWEDTHVGLAVSLNAAIDEKRTALMPINARYPLAGLMEALKAFPLPPRRRITIEYVMLGGVNDSLVDAKALVKVLHGVRSKVNLIPFNPWPGAPFVAPDPGVVLAFQAYLKERDFSVLIRRERGRDIQAACGQLAGGLSDERG